VENCFSGLPLSAIKKIAIQKNIMKQLIGLIALLFACSCIHAQIPQTLNYQGIARNNNGSPLANQTIKIRLTIKDAVSGGNTLYREIKSVTTNSYGLYLVTINDGTGTISGAFSAIQGANGGTFLQTEIDPSNGTTFLNAGTVQLHSVPYALATAQAGKWIDNNPVIQKDSQNAPVLPPLMRGQQLIWYPRKGSLRFGFLSNDINWNDENTGARSFAFGYSNIARGANAMAVGNLTVATGTNSFSG
jgi:hypothetical protein